MSSVSSTEALAITEIVFYGLALPLAIALLIKHGFRTGRAFLLLNILCLIRIVGGALTINVDLTTNPSSSEVGWAIALSSLGFGPLVVATSNFIDKARSTTSVTLLIPPRIQRLAVLLPIVGLILIIVSVSNTSTNSQSQSTAQTEFKAGAILFIVYYAFLLFLELMGLKNISSMTERGRILTIFVAIAMPFLGVRVAYVGVAAFSDDRFDLSIYLQAFMGALMEFIIIITYITCGFMLDKEVSQPMPEKDTLPLHNSDRMPPRQ